MPDINSSGRAAISSTLCGYWFLRSYAYTLTESRQQLFLIDEVSDEQNGKDARATCNVFLRALRDADWNDDSVLAKITKEYVIFAQH
jgi:hypothetical protein